jgi:hypothetical protein
MLDHELKREYQTWLHERDRADSHRRPDRTDEEIQAWAREDELPHFEEEVHFPDLRIEYREPALRRCHFAGALARVQGSHRSARRCAALTRAARSLLRHLS